MNRTLSMWLAALAIASFLACAQVRQTIGIQPGDFALVEVHLRG